MLVLFHLLDNPVKIALEQTILDNSVFFKLTLSMGFCEFGCDLATILQDSTTVKLKNRSRRLAQSSMVMGIFLFALSSAKSR